MTIKQASALKPGDIVIYDDGRPGHRNVNGRVLAVSQYSMTVHFDNRAEPSLIRFVEAEWMDHLTPVVSPTNHYQFEFAYARGLGNTWTHNYPSPEAAAEAAEKMRIARKARSVKIVRFATQFDADEAYANEADYG